MNFEYKDEKKIRLDQFLSKKIDFISREKIKKHIKEGFVYINESIINSSKRILKKNDKIIFLLMEDKNNDKLKPWLKGVMPDVIFENNDYMILNKPSGLVVHPGVGNQDYTLVNILIANKKLKLSSIDSNRPGIVHRLDKNTSGLMIIAKNDQFHNYISNEFSNNKVNKKYHLLTDGKYKSRNGIINAPIGRNFNNRKLMKVQIKNSKKAKSIFNVIESFKNNEYVEFQILTGRTHQIRVHSKFIGAPVLNDPEYGKKTFNSNFGQFLHAKELSFKNRKGELLTYTSPLPKEFNKKLEELRVLNK